MDKVDRMAGLQPALRLSPGVSAAAAVVQLTALFNELDLDSPAVDARLLVGEALAISPEELIGHPKRVLSDSERDVLEAFVTRRSRNDQCVCSRIGRNAHAIENTAFDRATILAVRQDQLQRRPGPRRCALC